MTFKRYVPMLKTKLLSIGRRPVTFHHFARFLPVRFGILESLERLINSLQGTIIRGFPSYQAWTTFELGEAFRDIHKVEFWEQKKCDTMKPSKDSNKPGLALSAAATTASFSMGLSEQVE
jgi:hypothetical protein